MGRRKFWEPNPRTMLEDLIAMAARHGRRPVDRRAAARKATETKRAKSEAASAARWAARQAMEAIRRARQTRFPAFGERIVDKLLACMEPGNWYGLGDVTRAAGLARHARGKFHQVMLPGRLIERCRNPDWRPGYVIWQVGEPKWLYRLTPKGDALRRAVLLVT